MGDPSDFRQGFANRSIWEPSNNSADGLGIALRRNGQFLDKFHGFGIVYNILDVWAEFFQKQISEKGPAIAPVARFPESDNRHTRLNFGAVNEQVAMGESDTRGAPSQNQLLFGVDIAESGNAVFHDGDFAGDIDQIGLAEGVSVAYHHS